MTCAWIKYSNKIDKKETPFSFMDENIHWHKYRICISNILNWEHEQKTFSDVW
jgi:hypothetical protein